MRDGDTTAVSRVVAERTMLLLLRERFRIETGRLRTALAPQDCGTCDACRSVVEIDVPAYEMKQLTRLFWSER